MLTRIPSQPNIRKSAMLRRTNSDKQEGDKSTFSNFTEQKKTTHSHEIPLHWTNKGERPTLWESTGDESNISRTAQNRIQHESSKSWKSCQCNIINPTDFI